ncbi:solute carrier family 22 member 6-like isoform X2 [Dromaius novaehollandiae]|uniref:solute carrier family 22 member 6-like isoform X2 n=1 Tax=Dromaius novaehollandiae TaxID=8790 RepID=UPI00311DEC12
MSFAELLARLGGMGRFQVTYVAALALPLLVLPSHNLLQNFTAGVPEHRCRPRPGANGTVPADGRCRRYAEPPRPLPGANGTAEAPTEPCRDGWVYQEGVFAHTIVTEWDLVCEARSLRQVAQAGYMAGVLLGSGVFGILSDKFGRRALLIWCYLQLGVTGTGAALAPSFGLYCLCRGLAGLAVAGVTLNSASLCMEWIPAGLRAAVGTANGYCYTLGQFVLAAAAFGLPRWRRLQLAVSLPFYLFFLYSWLFVESARWQAISGRPHLALEGLRKVARVNGRKEEGDKLDVETLRSLAGREQAPAGAVRSLGALARTPGMRRVSGGVACIWFSTSFAYYGLAMDLQPFGVDARLAQLLFAAADVPAKLASAVVLSVAGRRAAQAGALGLAGLCVLANVLVPRELQTLRLVFAIIGKGSLAASFNCAYIFSAELFPTVIRQTGMGLGGTMARVGSMGAPLVGLAADISPALPLVTYGAAALAAAAAAARLLPETRRAPLPETVADVERRAGRLKDEQPQVTVPLAPAEADRGEDGV